MFPMSRWLLGLLLLVFAPFAAASSFHTMIVFGDSLSDDGNLSAETQGKLPQSPYYLGHFSNGPVWVEYLAHELHILPYRTLNYAFGGAKTFGLKPPGLLAQVDLYKLHHFFPSKDALFIIWIGGDNYLHIKHSLSKQTINKMTDKAINDIQFAIDELHWLGAKTFLVVNLPNLSQTPLANLIDKKRGDSEYSENLARLTQAHNKKLLVAINKLKTDKSLTILFLDANKYFQAVRNNPKKYGFKNATARCFTGGFQGKPGTTCNNPQAYLFWDVIHPTTAAHQAIAQMALQLIRQATLNLQRQKKHVPLLFEGLFHGLFAN